MSTTPDGTAEGSWMQRAHQEMPGGRQRVDGGSSTAAVTPRAQNQGWDPYEVWLSRIEQPRRQRQRWPVV
jgi:hypothetical protein